MDGWVDGWLDGWMDGWTGGRADGWMDRLSKRRSKLNIGFFTLNAHPTHRVNLILTFFFDMYFVNNWDV
jgi:hypothetical protein